MTQLTNFQYDQLFQTLELLHTIFSKYFEMFLSPLSQSEYTIKNTKQFVKQICTKQVSDFYNLVSFDIKSLFTNVTLESD